MQVSSVMVVSGGGREAMTADWSDGRIAEENGTNMYKHYG